MEPAAQTVEPATPSPAARGGAPGIWCYPLDGEMVPSGRLLLLTEGGVAVLGHWKWKAGFVAWAALPQRRFLQATERTDGYSW